LRNKNFQLGLSHQYTKLQGFNLRPDMPNMLITASLFGFGADRIYVDFGWDNLSEKSVFL